MIWRKKIYQCLKRWKNTERIMHLSKYAVFGDVYKK